MMLFETYLAKDFTRAYSSGESSNRTGNCLGAPFGTQASDDIIDGNPASDMFLTENNCMDRSPIYVRAIHLMVINDNLTEEQHLQTTI